MENYNYYNSYQNQESDNSTSSTNKKTKKIKIEKPKEKKPRTRKTKWTPALLSFMILFFIMVVFASVIFSVEFVSYRRDKKNSKYRLGLVIEDKVKKELHDFYTVKEAVQQKENDSVYLGKIELHKLTKENFNSVMQKKNVYDIFTVYDFSDKENPNKDLNFAKLGIRIKVVKRTRIKKGKEITHEDKPFDPDDHSLLNVAAIDAYRPNYNTEGFFLILTHPIKTITYEYKIEKTYEFNNSISRVHTDIDAKKEKEQIAIYPKDYFQASTTNNTINHFEDAMTSIINLCDIDKRIISNTSKKKFWIVNELVDKETNQYIPRLLRPESYYASESTEDPNKCKFNSLSDIYVTASQPDEVTIEIHTPNPIEEGKTVPYTVMFFKLDKHRKIDKKTFRLIAVSNEYSKFLEIVQNNTYDPETEQFNKWVYKDKTDSEFLIFNKTYNEGEEFQISPNIIRTKFAVYFFKNKEELRKYFNDPTGYDKTSIFDRLIVEQSKPVPRSEKDLDLPEGYKHVDKNWFLCDNKEAINETLVPFEGFGNAFDINRKKDFYFIPMIEAGTVIEFYSYYESLESQERKQEVLFNTGLRYGYKGDRFLVPTVEDIRNYYVEGNVNSAPTKWELDTTTINNPDLSFYSYLQSLNPNADYDLVKSNDLSKPQVLKFYPKFEQTRINVSYLLEDLYDKSVSDEISYEKAEEKSSSHYYRTHKYMPSEKDKVLEKEIHELNWLTNDKTIIRTHLLNSTGIDKVMLIDSNQEDYDSLLGYEIDKTKTLEANNASETGKIKIDTRSQNKPQEILLYLKRKKFQININYHKRTLDIKTLSVSEQINEKFVEDYYFGNSKLIISNTNLQKLSLVQSYDSDGWSIYKDYKPEYSPRVGTQFGAGDYDRKWSTLDGSSYISFEENPLYKFSVDYDLDKNDLVIDFFVCYKKKSSYSVTFYQTIDNVKPGTEVEYDFDKPIYYAINGYDLTLNNVEIFKKGSAHYNKLVNGRTLRVGEFYDHHGHQITSSVELLEDKQPVYVRYFAPIKVSLFHLDKDGINYNDAYFEDGNKTKIFYPQENFNYEPVVPDYNRGNIFEAWDFFEGSDPSAGVALGKGKSKVFTLDDQDKTFSMRSSFKYFIYEIRFFNDERYNELTKEMDFKQISTSLFNSFNGREENKRFNLKLKIDELETRLDEYSKLKNFKLFKKYTRKKFNQDNNANNLDLQSLELYNHRKTIIECYFLRNKYIFDFFGTEPNGHIEDYPKQEKYFGEILSFNTFNKIKGYKIEDKITFKGKLDTEQEVNEFNIKTLFDPTTPQSFGEKNTFFKDEEKPIIVKYNNEEMHTFCLEYSIKIYASYQRKDKIKLEIHNVIDKYTNLPTTSANLYSSLCEGNYETLYVTEYDNALANSLLYNEIESNYPELFPSGAVNKKIGETTILFKFAQKIAVVKQGSSEEIKTHIIKKDVQKDLRDFTNWTPEDGNEKLIIYIFYYAPLTITNSEVKEDKKFVFPGETVNAGYFTASTITIINFSSLIATKTNAIQNYSLNYIVQENEQDSSKDLDLKPIYLPFELRCFYLIRSHKNPQNFEIKEFVFDKYYRHKDQVIKPTTYRFINEVIDEINLTLADSEKIDAVHFQQTTDSTKFNEHRALINLDNYTLGTNEIYAYPKKTKANFIGSTLYHWYYNNESFSRNTGIIEEYFYTCVPKIFASSTKVHRRINNEDSGFLGWKRNGTSIPATKQLFYEHHIDSPLEIEGNFDTNITAPNKISFNIVDKDNEIIFTNKWNTQIHNDGSGKDVVTLDCNFVNNYQASILKYHIPQAGGTFEIKYPGEQFEYLKLTSQTIMVEFVQRTLLNFEFETDSDIQDKSNLDENSLNLISNIKVLPGKKYEVKELFVKGDWQKYRFVSIRYGANKYTAVEGNNQITITTDSSLYIKFEKYIKVSKYIVDGKDSTDNLVNPNALDNYYYLRQDTYIALPIITLKNGNVHVTSYTIYKNDNGNSDSITEVTQNQFFILHKTLNLDEIVIYCNFVTGNIYADYYFFNKVNDFSLLSQSDAQILKFNQIVKKGDYFPLLTPKIEGYRFVKWTYEWWVEFVNPKYSNTMFGNGTVLASFTFNFKDKAKPSNSILNNRLVIKNYYIFKAEFVKEIPVIYKGLGPTDNSFAFIKDPNTIVKLQSLRFLEPGKIINLPKLNKDTGLDHYSNKWKITYYLSGGGSYIEEFSVNEDYTIRTDKICDKYAIEPVTKPLIKVVFNFNHVGGGLNDFEIIQNDTLKNRIKHYVTVARGETIDLTGDPMVNCYQPGRYSWGYEDGNAPGGAIHTINNQLTVGDDYDSIIIILEGVKQVKLNYDFSSVGLLRLNDFSYLTQPQITSLKRFANAGDTIQINISLNLMTYQDGTWYYKENNNLKEIPSGGYYVKNTDSEIRFCYVAKPKIIIDYDFTDIGLANLNDFSALSVSEANKLKAKRYLNDNTEFRLDFTPNYVDYQQCQWIIKSGSDTYNLPYTTKTTDTKLVCKLVTKKKIIVTYDFSSVGKANNDFSWLTETQQTDLNSKLRISRNEPFTISFNPIIAGYQQTYWTYLENDSSNARKLENYTPGETVDKLTIKLFAKPTVRFYYDFSNCGLSTPNDFSLLPPYQRTMLESQLSLNSDQKFKITFNPEITGYRFVKWTYHFNNVQNEEIIEANTAYSINEYATEVYIKLYADKGVEVKYIGFGSGTDSFNQVTHPSQSVLQSSFRKYVFKTLNTNSPETEKDRFVFPSNLEITNKHFFKKYKIIYNYGENLTTSVVYNFANGTDFIIDPTCPWENLNYIEVNPDAKDFVPVEYKFSNTDVSMDLISLEQQIKLKKLALIDPFVINGFPWLDIDYYPFLKYRYTINEDLTEKDMTLTSGNWQLYPENTNSAYKVTVIIYTYEKVATSLEIVGLTDNEAKNLIINPNQLEKVNLALNNTFYYKEFVLPHSLELAGYTFYRWEVREYGDGNVLYNIKIQQNLNEDFRVTIDDNNIKSIKIIAVTEITINYDINGVTDLSNVINYQEVDMFQKATRLKPIGGAYVSLPKKVTISGYEFVRYIIVDDNGLRLIINENNCKLVNQGTNASSITIKAIFEVKIPKKIINPKNLSENLILLLNYNDYNSFNEINDKFTSNKTLYRTSILPNLKINGYSLICYKLKYTTVKNASTQEVTKNYGEIFNVSLTDDQFVTAELVVEFRKMSRVNIVVVENDIIYELDNQVLVTNKETFRPYQTAYVTSSNSNANFANVTVAAGHVFDHFELLINGYGPSTSFGIGQNMMLDLYDKVYTIKICIRNA